MNALDVWKTISARLHLILICLAVIIVYSIGLWILGGNAREKKIRENTKVTDIEVVVVHDSLYPAKKTMALKTKTGSGEQTAELRQRVDSTIAARLDSSSAVSDSVREFLYSVVVPFSGWTVDSTIAISKSGQDTVTIPFRIDATADPMTRTIAPLSLALAPFDLPKKETTIKSTVFEGYPWYRQAVPFGLGVAGASGAIMAGAKTPVVLGIGAGIFVVGEVLQAAF